MEKVENISEKKFNRKPSKTKFLIVVRRQISTLSNAEPEVEAIMSSGHM